MSDELRAIAKEVEAIAVAAFVAAVKAADDAKAAYDAYIAERDKK